MSALNAKWCEMKGAKWGQTHFLFLSLAGLKSGNKKWCLTPFHFGKAWEAVNLCRFFPGNLFFGLESQLFHGRGDSLFY